VRACSIAYNRPRAGILGDTLPETEVLVVGAGPVGLALAIALGQQGVRCTLIERKDAPEFLPKMERCNARTMEILHIAWRGNRAPGDPRGIAARVTGHA
jgi:flavin-dependent dehydrogenase